MEFRYRAIDDRGSSATHVPPPPPSSSSSTTHPLPYASNALTQTLDSTSYPLSLTLNNELALAQRRLLLKAQMRREIILEEMSMMSHHLINTPQHGFSVRPYMFPFLMMQQQQRHLSSAQSMELLSYMAAILRTSPSPSPTQPIMQPLSNDGKETLVLPLPRPSQPIKPMDGKETIFLPLTRPRPLPLVDDTVMQKKSVNFNVAEKRKAETLLVEKKRKAEISVVADGINVSNEAPSDISGKKRRMEWSCNLCQVKTTSQQGLEDHLNGKKHKAKAALSNARKTPKEKESNDDEGKKHKANKAFLNASKTLKEEEESNDDEEEQHKAKAAFLISSKTLEQEESDDGEEKKGKAALLNGSTTPEESNNDEIPVDESQKHHKFWCQMCRVGTTSEAVMTGHRNGKKHMNLLRKKGGSIIAISTRPEDVQEVETIAAKT